MLNRLYSQMLLIRRVEETLLDLFAAGKLVGTTHTYIGQEADAVGVIAHLERGRDVVFSSHRCHGHYLAFTDDLDGLLGEVMGRTTGVCGGRGGSQHLCNGNFYSNGVQGSIVPVATGIAVAERERRTGAVTVVFLGDGTMGQGTVYECLNLASLWSLPILFVVEDNHYAQSTPKRLAVAGSIPERARPFGIEPLALDSTDVLEIHDLAARAIEGVRSTGRPGFLVLDTYRFSPHSKGDDTRDPAEVEAMRDRDPLLVAERQLPRADVAAIREDVEARLAEALEAAEAAPAAGAAKEAVPLTAMRCAQVLNRALHDVFEAREDVYLIGEDVLDPYGGAFKVTQGLSDRWPRRVLTTPISEASLFGVTAGMALRGLRPILEIMFGDFVALGFDQIVNGIAKFPEMYDGRVHVPLVVRTPMGGRRGYGPTHSQSLEKLLLGVPGVCLVTPSECHDLGALLSEAVADDRPVFFVENKLMYGRTNRRPVDGWVGSFRCVETASTYPALTFSGTDSGGASATVATYGGMLPIVLDAVTELIVEHELFCEVVALGRLLPPDLDPVLDSVARTGALVTAEEGTLTGGVGAELAARVQAAAWRDLRCPIARVAAADTAIPAAPDLERAVLPGVEDVVSAVLELETSAARRR